MNKKLFMKLRTEDRIEYLIRQQDMSGWVTFFILMLLIILSVANLTHSLGQPIEELRKMLVRSMFVLIIGCLVVYCVEYYLTNKLDDEFLERLSIRSKGDK